MSSKKTAKATKAAKPSAMQIFFPNRRVILSDEREVVMRPIPLKKLSAVMDSFSAILSLQLQGFSPAQMLTVAVDHIAKLLEQCVVSDNQNSEAIELYAADAPYVFNVFLDQNMNELVLGEWKALVTRLGAMFPELGESVTQIQEQMIQTEISPKE